MFRLRFNSFETFFLILCKKYAKYFAVMKILVNFADEIKIIWYSIKKKLTLWKITKRTNAESLIPMF